AFAALWTVRRRDRPMAEIAAGWGVWALVAPRVAWTWYAAWCLPFFLLAIQEPFRLRPTPLRLSLFIVALAVLNLQIDSLIVNVGTLALLIGLLWLSFQPVREHAPKNA